MPDSIIELIAKNRKTALEGITTAAGFDNTIASVQRPMPEGQTFTALPMIVLVQGPQAKEGEKTEALIYKTIPFRVFVLGVINTASDSRSVDEYMNSLQADIERAWLADETCGGNAIDTSFDGANEFEPLDGQPDIGRSIDFSVKYKHRFKDPKTQF